MVKVNFEDKQLNDENESIEKRYESTICNDCRLKPATYFIVKGLGRYSDYTYSYVCISSKNKYDKLSTFGLEPQGITEVHNLQSLSTVG